MACIDALALAQPLGEESRDYLKSLIAQNGDCVTLKIVDTDRYGRKVAEVLAGSKFLQAPQVKGAMAYVYDCYLNNCPDAAAVKQAQDFAKRSRVGVWSKELDPDGLVWELRGDKYYPMLQSQPPYSSFFLLFPPFSSFFCHKTLF